MSSKRCRKASKLDETPIQTEDSDNDESQIQEQYNESYASRSRSSKRLSSKKQQKLIESAKKNIEKREKDVSLNVSVQDVRRQYKHLKQPILDAFSYDIKEQDIYYLQDFFIELPKLKDIWKRIGFNKDIQEQRLETLYEKLIETFHDIIESEEDLENNILSSIEEQKLLINELCLELSIKPSELKLKKARSILEEDDILRSELKNLEAEKHKRLSEYNELVIVENQFADKLCIDPIEKRNTVPSQKMLNELSNRITELTQLCKDRKQEMQLLKDDIIKLNEDLEMSRSDSFAEMIVMESIDEVPLGEEELRRTKELRDELKHKDNLIVNEIKSLRMKIRELWTKLNIGNESIHDLVMSEEFTDTKRNMVTLLREEHDICVKIKMENMQKFIESVRVEIKEYCVKMFMGPEEMRSLDIDLLQSTDFTEELLTRHEQKKEELEFIYEESQVLFEKTAKWIKLWNDFIEFEEKTKDPARFKVRGYNMLGEEKQRKLFNTQLPKLEDDLAQHANEYVNTNDRKEFTINGLFWAEYLQRKKQDHEESKMNERKEKQIMRDNMKKNESRYGSKPVTPLALRNKRKLLASQQESQLSTPSRNKTSKIMKTEKTPGTSILGTSRMTGGKVVKPATRAVNKLAAKRKSKTPAKNRFRKSRGGLQVDSTINDTIKSTATTISSSSYQTINSTVTSNTSRLTSTSTRSTTSRVKEVKPSKPPQSSSAKYAAASQRMENVLHSTASGTFIEEENFEGIENVDLTIRQKKATNSSKLTTLSSQKFNFQHPDSSKYEKFNTQEINYTDFSRDLVKMQGDLKANLSRFGSTTLGDRTNTNLSRYGTTRSGKTGISSLATRAQTEKEKLTSTLLSS